MPRPASVVEHASGKRHHISFTVHNNFLGFFCFGNQADSHGGHAGSFFDLRG